MDIYGYYSENYRISRISSIVSVQSDNDYLEDLDLIKSAKSRIFVLILNSFY